MSIGLSSEAAGAQLAVIKVRGRWLVLLDGKAAGSFASRDEAVSCALAVRAHPWLQGSVREVLVSSDAGEVLRAADR